MAQPQTIPVHEGGKEVCAPTSVYLGLFVPCCLLLLCAACRLHKCC